MPKVLVIADGEVDEYEFGSDLTIGRGDTNIVRLHGPEISRAHAVIQRRNGQISLRDLGSKNGIFLNGFKTESGNLSPGDEIQIGKYLLLFEPAPDANVEGMVERQRAYYTPSSSPAINEIRETSSFSKEALEKVLRNSSPQVFYEMHEVAALIESPELQSSDDFVVESLRMHRELLRMQQLPRDADSDRMFQFLLEAAVAALRADRGLIAGKSKGDDMMPRAVFPTGSRIVVNSVVLQNTLVHGRAVVCNKPAEDPRLIRSKGVPAESVGSLIAVPVFSDGEVSGLIYLDALKDIKAFRPAHLHLLNVIGSLASVHMARVNGVSEEKASKVPTEVPLEQVDRTFHAAHAKPGQPAPVADKRRAYLVAREEWIRNGRQGPEPAAPQL